MITQEANLVADLPEPLLEILARFTRQLRESPAVNQRSGVSARFAIAGAETIAAAARHRATVRGEDEAVARVVDLESAIDVLGGKIEFESGEEGRERDILDHLLRMATAETVRELYRGIDLGPLVEALDGSVTVTTGEQITAAGVLRHACRAWTESGLTTQICERLGATNDGQRAGAVELALEGLYLARRISKDSGDGETLYG